MSPEVCAMLFILVTKHALVDFPLQTPYMLRRVSETGWVLPLLTHSALHGVTTALLLCYFVSWKYALLLGLLDFTAHTFIDAWKARLANYPINDKRFWWAFGLDQWLHALTYIQIVYLAS